jgi:hypothetical protein
MNLQRLGRIIATTTILMGVLVCVIGALLSYAIPDSPQAFVDWVQNKQYNDVISSVASTVNSHTTPATTRPAVVPEISSNGPTPGSTTNPAFSPGRLSVGIEDQRAIGGPSALTLLAKGAALGGATGLILGLPLGILISILDQLVLWCRAVIDAVRNMFSNLRTTVFRR